MKNEAITAHLVCPTPMGDLLLGATAQGLAGAWFIHGQRDSPPPGSWGREDLPLDLSAGTPFQQDVWHALLGIGSGDSATYTEVAARIGRPAAVRAVGTAVGSNPLIVIVPCHRVLGSTGALTGFGGGLGRKAALLQLEGWRIDGAEAGTPDATLRRLRARRAADELFD